MFQTVPLTIIRSYALYTQQYIQVMLTAASRIRMELRSILNLLASCQQPCMTYTIAVCTVENF